MLLMDRYSECDIHSAKCSTFYKHRNISRNRIVERHYLFQTGTAVRPDALFNKRLLQHHLASEFRNRLFHVVQFMEKI